MDQGVVDGGYWVDADSHDGDLADCVMYTVTNTTGCTYHYMLPAHILQSC